VRPCADRGRQDCKDATRNFKTSWARIFLVAGSTGGGSGVVFSIGRVITINHTFFLSVPESGPALIINKGVLSHLTGGSRATSTSLYGAAGARQKGLDLLESAPRGYGGRGPDSKAGFIFYIGVVSCAGISSGKLEAGKSFKPPQLVARYR